MSEFKILIVNSLQDEALAVDIKNTIEHVSEFKPYQAHQYPTKGANSREKILNAIEDCHTMISLLTNKASSDQLVNQCLGYAFKIKRLRDDFNTVTISESDLKLNGLVNRENEEFIFMDKVSHEIFLHKILWSLRKKVPNGLNSNVLKLKIKCCNCRDLKGIPNEFYGFISSQNDINRAYSGGKKSLSYFCPFCGASNEINILTFDNLSLKIQTPITA
ncbi:hypothetical protein JW865_04975 [Candidatus Bathyarchaeota archaeon]|nr:hypothetical protein [Candidatus Bathyarchaeota archaeon]